MGKGRGGSGVGQVVGRDIDRLDRGNGTLLGRGDSLLQLSHFGAQSRLITHRRGDTPQQRRDLGARLRESENVVDEEQDVPHTALTEMFGNGQCRQCDSQAGAGRLIHLTEDQRGMVQHGVILAGHRRLLHLQPEVVALPRPFPDAGKDGVAAMSGRDPCDEFLDDHGFPHAGTAKETGLTAADEGTEQIDDLDTGLKHLTLGGEIDQLGRLAMDGFTDLAGQGFAVVDGLPEEVQHSAQGLVTHRYRQRSAGVEDLQPAP